MNFRDYLRDKFTSPAVKEQKRQLLTDSKVFCMAPWLQLHAQTNGTVAPCCMAAVDDNNKLGDLRTNPNIEEAWNSANTKKLRLNMMLGKKSNICNHCYAYEKIGKFSEREQYNKDWSDHFSTVTATLPNGGLKGLNVPILDIRFSNKCNYKCRICDSAYSTLWFDEEQKINRPRRPPTYDTEKEIYVANDQKKFWESYNRLLPGVKRIHFAGGEPLFMDEHYQTLERLIELGKTDVILSYNTNFSVLRYKKHNITDLWNKFEKVEVWASLDGMGQQGDYQRKGQKWDKVEENIRIMQQQCKHVFFGVNITVSILNILHIPVFYQYLVENKFVQPGLVNLYLLFSPDYFSITNLTPELKAEALHRFTEFENNYLSTLPNSEHIKNHIKAVTTYMMSETGTLQNEFKHWINAVDNLRNENFISIFPELEGMMKKGT